MSEITCPSCNLKNPPRDGFIETQRGLGIKVVCLCPAPQVIVPSENLFQVRLMEEANDEWTMEIGSWVKDYGETRSWEVKEKLPALKRPQVIEQLKRLTLVVDDANYETVDGKSFLETLRTEGISISKAIK